jgi:hypothetical protein
MEVGQNLNWTVICMALEQRSRLREELRSKEAKVVKIKQRSGGARPLEKMSLDCRSIV